MITAAIVFTVSCNKSEDDAVTAQMTMTTHQTRVTLQMGGSGTITINWGDGNKTLDVIPAWSQVQYTHEYANSSVRNITVSGNNITYLVCNDISLSHLDVSGNNALTYLGCWNNQLKSLDISKNTALAALNCVANELTGLDVSKNILLMGLQCYNNQLTQLDVSNNVVLEFLLCDDNKLTAEALNTMFETLHNNTLSSTKEIRIMLNPGADSCDKSIVENKGWRVVSNFQEQ